MKRITVGRLVALLVLLIHGSAYSGALLLDGIVAARANASVAHVEADSGAKCFAHDEATCQLCRVGSTTICVVMPNYAIAPIKRVVRPIGDASGYQLAITRTALHSRAPPTT